jgi:hypothetical protein
MFKKIQKFLGKNVEVLGNIESSVDYWLSDEDNNEPNYAFIGNFSNSSTYSIPKDYADKCSICIYV